MANHSNAEFIGNTNEVLCKSFSVKAASVRLNDGVFEVKMMLPLIFENEMDEDVEEETFYYATRVVAENDHEVHEDIARIVHIALVAYVQTLAGSAPTFLLSEWVRVSLY
jgi:hypothetical protein